MPKLQMRLAVGLFLLHPAAPGCGEGGSSASEAQRADRSAMALEPIDIVEKQRVRREAAALYDAEGELLPSDDQLAGIVLPRGLRPKLTVENRHYYESDLPLAHLRNYFLRRLKEPRIVPEGPLSFRFEHARTGEGKEGHLVTLRVSASARNRKIAEVMVEDLSSAEPATITSFEQSQAQLRALQEHAE